MSKVESSPPLNIFYKSDDYTGPLPDSSALESYCRLFSIGGVYVAKLSPNLVVKYGPSVTTLEAQNLLFVQKHAENIPVPRLHACYRIGPYDQNEDDHGSKYDTFIIMDYVQGRSLDHAWSDLSEDAKLSIAQELGKYIRELRSISQEGDAFIGSVDRGPLPDMIFEHHDEQGPFASEEELNSSLVNLYHNNVPKANLRHHLQGALAQHKHEICFTHGDLRPPNIIVHNERVSGIVDWELSAWYPAYWDFVKCFKVGGWEKDWPDFVLTVLEPWWCEWVSHELVTRHVW